MIDMAKFTRLAIAAGTLATVCAGFATSAHAVPIKGRFNMTFGTVVVSLGEVDWAPPVNSGFNATETNGSFEVIPTLATRTGVFLDPVFNTLPSTGFIEDLSANPLDANYTPVNTPLQDLDFITLAEKPTWRFVLTGLLQGNVPGAPYFLTQLGQNVSATITVRGIACDSVDNDCNDPEDVVTRWTAILSAQYTNTTIAAMTNFILAGGILPENTWSGTFAAPEPGSLALLGIGILGFAGLARRKLRV